MRRRTFMQKLMIWHTTPLVPSRQCSFLAWWGTPPPSPSTTTSSTTWWWRFHTPSRSSLKPWTSIKQTCKNRKTLTHSMPSVLCTGHRKSTCKLYQYKYYLLFIIIVTKILSPGTILASSGENHPNFHILKAWTIYLTRRFFTIQTCHLSHSVQFTLFSLSSEWKMQTFPKLSNTRQRLWQAKSQWCLQAKFGSKDWKVK